MVSAGRISLKQLTLDVMLRNLTKFLTTCLVFHSPLSDVEKSRPRKVLRFLVLLLCKQFSLCFSLVMRAIWWANVADSDFIFRRISFRYWWESAKQYNISRMYLQLSTKLSQKCLKMIKIVFWKWFVGGFRCFRRFLIDLANSMYPPQESSFFAAFAVKSDSLIGSTKYVCCCSFVTNGMKSELYHFIQARRVRSLKGAHQKEKALFYSGSKLSAYQFTKDRHKWACGPSKDWIAADV